VRAERQRSLIPRSGLSTSQILFGDLHVHTTFSADAFEASLPILSGDGAHPPADACDFARYCADLDFWALTEHAEFLDPQRWTESRESVRACDERGGDPASPDMVSFLGWEWTQIGSTPENHYGHKNVILREVATGTVPARPIAYEAPLEERFTVTLDPRGLFLELLKRPWLDFANRGEYWDNLRYMIETVRVQTCREGVPSTDLPADCREVAATPDELFRKLRAWGGQSIVIPHGNAWGLYTPPGTSWDKQLVGAMHDAERQTLIEVHSGHGNSEEHRAWRATLFDEDGDAMCPATTADYEPCCQRAGEIIRSRCEQPDSAACSADVQRARDAYVAAGSSGHLTVPGARVEDWLDCGQCRDCFLPAFSHRPGGSVQAAMATTVSEEGEERRFRFGFIASSDNHTARPGTGYKEYARTRMTDTSGPIDAAWSTRLYDTGANDATSTKVRMPEEITITSPHAIYETERRTSFLATGGLVAVHARSRTRDAIWEGMDRREVYATSGPRILLFFDLLNGEDGRQPMGSEARLAEPPRFEVRALGALEQKPGCPPHSRGLSVERLEGLCAGECYNPGDRRLRVARIEVIRIRPGGQSQAQLMAAIEDPWRIIECPHSIEGCRVEFEDAEFPASGRDALYYVRAIQEPTDAVAGAGLRCEIDVTGACSNVDPCHGGLRTRADDDCLAPIEERAWSSPIFVDHKFDPRAASAVAPTRPDQVGRSVESAHSRR